MARLIEVALLDADAPVSQLHMVVGDVLMCAGLGGRVHGPDVLELLGPFITGVATGSGDVLSPAGLPNKVMFVARQPGHTSIEVFVGDMSRPPQVFKIDVDVGC